MMTKQKRYLLSRLSCAALFVCSLPVFSAAPLATAGAETAGETVRYEAEADTVELIDCQAESTAGYAEASGQAGVGGVDHTTSRVNFRVNIPQDGLYLMKLAYCTLGENASVLMETEEKFTYLVRCETKTSWSGFAQTPPSETTIALKAGEQVLSFRKGKSSVRFDYIELQRTGEYKAQTPSIPAGFTVYEAENAVLGDTAGSSIPYVTDSSYASNGQCIGGINQTTNFISFDVTVPEAGEYEMRLVYSIATGFPDADFEVQVNGTPYTRLACYEQNGDWLIFAPEAVSATYLYLNVGKNTITLTDSRWCNMDCIAIAPAPYTEYQPSGEEKNNTIDMYLIGGQSNAAGYSEIDATVADESFSNVIYAGQTDYRMSEDRAPSSDSLTQFVSPVGTGLGNVSSHMGPEYGIAKALNSYYTPDDKAVIFKTAAGGTALQNKNVSGSANYGNWYPTMLPGGNHAEAGRLYDLFLENFTTVYNQLVEQGYTPVIRGMAWVQGESDLAAPEAYATLIRLFIRSLRDDLGAITDSDLSEMPFIIAEVSPTFSSAAPSTVSTNETFNAMLRSLTSASDLKGVYTVSTSDLNINELDENGANAVLGTDAYHYNGQDIVTLGTRLGEALLQYSGKADDPRNFEISYSFDPDKGSIDETLSSAITVKEGDILAVYPVPQEGYVVEKVTFNGTELTYNPERDCYESEPVTEGGIVEILFAEKPTPLPPEDSGSSDTSSDSGSTSSDADSDSDDTSSPGLQDSTPAASSEADGTGGGCGSVIASLSDTIILIVGGALILRKQNLPKKH